MSYSLKSATLALFLILALGTVGLAHGWITGRWDPYDPNLLSRDMDKLPLKIGAWKSVGTEKISSDPRIVDAGDCLSRRYENENNGAIVTIMLSRGMPGPMVIKHLPTECYVSNGFEIETQPKNVLINRRNSDRADEFLVTTFKKANEADPQTLRLFWSWSGDGTWQAPERARARLVFAHFKVLYKLYVIRAIHGQDQGTDDAAMRDFIRELTEAMRVSLFAQGSS